MLTVKIASLAVNRLIVPGSMKLVFAQGLTEDQM